VTAPTSRSSSGQSSLREVDKLRRENDSMRTDMRRCVSCDYRLDYQINNKQRQRDVHLIATAQACRDVP